MSKNWLLDSRKKYPFLNLSSIKQHIVSISLVFGETEKYPFFLIMPHDVPECWQKTVCSLPQTNFRHINSHIGSWQGDCPHIYSIRVFWVSAVPSTFAALLKHRASCSLLFPQLCSLGQCNISPGRWEPNPYQFGLDLLNSLTRELCITRTSRPYIATPVLYF